MFPIKSQKEITNTLGKKGRLLILMPTNVDIDIDKELMIFMMLEYEIDIYRDVEVFFVGLPQGPLGVNI